MKIQLEDVCANTNIGAKLRNKKRLCRRELCKEYTNNPEKPPVPRMGNLDHYFLKHFIALLTLKVLAPPPFGKGL